MRVSKCGACIAPTRHQPACVTHRRSEALRDATLVFSFSLLAAPPCAAEDEEEGADAAALPGCGSSAAALLNKSSSAFTLSSGLFGSVPWREDESAL